MGITNDYGYCAGHGTWSLELIWDLGVLQRITDVSRYSCFSELAADKPDWCREQNEHLKALSAVISVYFATGSSIRSRLCTEVCPAGESICAACAQIGLHKPLRKSLLQRIARAKRGTVTSLHSTNKKHLSSTRERILSNLGRTRRQRTRTMLSNANRLSLRLGAEVASLLTKVEGSWRDRNFPAFLQNLISAHEKGMLQIKNRTVDQSEDDTGLLSQALHDILTGISKALMNGTTRRRKLTRNEKLFYAALYNVKGPWAHSLVSGVMLGPSVDTTKKVRSELSQAFKPIWLEHGVKNVSSVFEVIQSLDSRFPGLSSAPGIIAEDATSLWRKIELERITKHDGVIVEDLTVRVWGLNNCCTHEFIIHSLEDLQKLMADCVADDVASYLYAWVWVPQVYHAPWFPLRIDITNNKFDRMQVFRWWRELDVACHTCGLLPIGHVGDGDARMRASSFYLMRELGNDTAIGPWLKERTGIKHKLLDFLKIAITVEGHKKLAFQDTMHLLWRWRRHLLTCKRAMHIGPGLFVNWRHLEGCPHLRGGDLKYTDKQNWAGTQRIFSLPTLLWLQSAMQADPEQHNYAGTIMFIWWGYQLQSAWYGDAGVDPLITIAHAASVLNGLLYWRFWVDKRALKKGAEGALEHYTIQQNFMTRETFLDTIISCSTRILMFVMYRDDPKLRKWKPVGNRVSSCFCEHLNQHIRSSETNTTAVTAWSAMNHVRHYIAQVQISAQADFDLPKGKRGMTHSVKAEGMAQSRADDAYWAALTDESISGTLDAAVASSNNWLQRECRFGDEIHLDDQADFFSHPCLHFPKMDCFRNYISPAGQAEPPVDFSWPTGGDDRDDIDESCEDIDVGDGHGTEQVPAAEPVDGLRETSECLAMFNEVLEYHQQPLKPGCDHDVTWRTLCTFNADFNGHSLNVCMQQHRATRFQTRALFSAHCETTRDMDEWDFIALNSDVAVCLDVEGTWAWRIANVEGIRRLKSEPSANAKLSAMETDTFPHKVSVHDMRASFCVRWYRECELDGMVLPGFQNAAHARISKGKCRKVYKEHNMTCCQKCCAEGSSGRTFYLPMHDDVTLAHEPVTEIPACIILDTVQMVKCDHHRNVWLLGCGNKEMVVKKFRASGGPAPPKLPPALVKTPAQAALATKQPKKAAQAQPQTAAVRYEPTFHIDNGAMHEKPVHDLIGHRVWVYWPHEESWYAGMVVRKHEIDAGCLQVKYDDGDQRWHSFGCDGAACEWGLCPEVPCGADGTPVAPVMEVSPSVPTTCTTSPMAEGHATQTAGTPLQPPFHANDCRMHGLPVGVLLGSKVWVYWPECGKWYLGKCTDVHAKDLGYLRVHYEDGQKEWHSFEAGPDGCLWGLAVENDSLTPATTPHEGQAVSKPETGDLAAHGAGVAPSLAGAAPPPFDTQDAVYHKLEPAELVGATLHVASAATGAWHKGVVTRLHANKVHLEVAFEEGRRAWHDLRPGGDPWGLACVCPEVHEALSLKGGLKPESLCLGDPEDVLVHRVWLGQEGRPKSARAVMRRRELRCMGPGMWLSGVAMEVCMDVVCARAGCHVVKQAFYGALVQSGRNGCEHRSPRYDERLRKWFQHAQAVWHKRKLLVIVHVHCGKAWSTALGNHWVLAVIDLDRKAFRYHDPLGPWGRTELYNDQRDQCISNLRFWIQAEHPMDWVRDAPVHEADTCPIQGNAFDCGIFSILYGVCEALDVPLSSLPFGQQHARVFREQLVAQLVH